MSEYEVQVANGRWKPAQAGPSRKGYATSKELANAYRRAAGHKLDASVSTKSARLEALNELPNADSFIRLRGSAARRPAPKRRTTKAKQAAAPAGDAGRRSNSGNADWNGMLQRKLARSRTRTFNEVMGTTMKSLQQAAEKIDHDTLVRELSGMQYPVLNPNIPHDEDMFQQEERQQFDDPNLEDQQREKQAVFDSAKKGLLKANKLSDADAEKLTYKGAAGSLNFRVALAPDAEGVDGHDEALKWKKAYEGEEEWRENLKNADPLIDYSASQARKILNKSSHDHETLILEMHTHAQMGHTGFVLAILNQIGDRFANVLDPRTGHHVLATAGLNFQHATFKALLSRARTGEVLKLNVRGQFTRNTPLQDLVQLYMEMVAARTNKMSMLKWGLADAVHMLDLEHTIADLVKDLKADDVTARFGGGLLKGHTILTAPIFRRDRLTPQMLLGKLARDNDDNSGVTFKTDKIKKALLAKTGLDNRTPFMEAVFALGHYETDAAREAADIASSEERFTLFNDEPMGSPTHTLVALMDAEAPVTGRTAHTGHTALNYVVQASLGVRKEEAEGGTVEYTPHGIIDVTQEGLSLDGNADLGLDSYIIHLARKQLKHDNRKVKAKHREAAIDAALKAYVDTPDHNGVRAIDTAVSTYNPDFIDYVAAHVPTANTSGVQDLPDAEAFSVSDVESYNIKRVSKALAGLRTAPEILAGGKLSKHRREAMERAKQGSVADGTVFFRIPRLYDHDGEKVVDGSIDKISIPVRVPNPELPTKGEEDKWKKYVDYGGAITKQVKAVVTALVAIKNDDHQIRVLEAIVDPFLSNCRAQFDIDGIRDAVVDIRDDLLDDGNAAEADKVTKLYQALAELTMLRRGLGPTAEGVENICSELIRLRNMYKAANTARKTKKDAPTVTGYDILAASQR